MGNKSTYLIVLMDMFSRWPEVCFTKNIETRHVISFLKDVFGKEGIPGSLLSDNGVQFVSKEMGAFLKEYGVNHKRSALYHPETNGMVERFNRVLKEVIQIAKSDGEPWKDVVKNRIQVYRFTPHSTTGNSPFELC